MLIPSTSLKLIQYTPHIENPYEAAQKFLVKHDLPASYVDEVVRFIEKNTGGATLGGQGGLDPYTGTSSYRSSGPAPQHSAPSSSFSGDPWSRGSSSTANGTSLLPHVRARRSSTYLAAMYPLTVPSVLLGRPRL